MGRNLGRQHPVRWACSVQTRLAPTPVTRAGRLEEAAHCRGRGLGLAAPSVEGSGARSPPAALSVEGPGAQSPLGRSIRWSGQGHGLPRAAPSRGRAGGAVSPWPLRPVEGPGAQSPPGRSFLARVGGAVSPGPGGQCLFFTFPPSSWFAPGCGRRSLRGSVLLGHSSVLTQISLCRAGVALWGGRQGWEIDGLPSWPRKTPSVCCLWDPGPAHPLWALRPLDLCCPHGPTGGFVHPERDF